MVRKEKKGAENKQTNIKTIKQFKISRKANFIFYKGKKMKKYKYIKTVSDFKMKFIFN